MKFSEIEEKDWAELEPYFDTCLLPLTCLSGAETPWETTKALETLQQMMDLVEVPFKGRVVTYPAVHYVHEQADHMIETICTRLKQSGFRYVILITAQSAIDHLLIPAADLLITPTNLPTDGAEMKQNVRERIATLWTSS